MGESFYAIDQRFIQKRIEADAKKAGALGANESYRNVAVSGQNMNYISTTEWAAATQGVRQARHHGWLRHLLPGRWVRYVLEHVQDPAREDGHRWCQRRHLHALSG